MKDIGINDVDIALMYAILPFSVFIGPPIVGFFADKLGNYMRVLLLNIVGCAVFHTLLLAVPTNLHRVHYPNTTLSMVGRNVNLTWAKCAGKGNGCTHIRNPEEEDEDPIPIYFELNHCNYNCTNSKYDIEKTLEEYKFLGLSMTIEDVICNHIGRKHCKVWPGTNRIEFIRINSNVSGNYECGRADIAFYTDSDPCITNNIEDEMPLGIMNSCSMDCQVRTNLVEECGATDKGSRLITNGIYFIFRMLASMCLACCFTLLDAQTIRMCDLEEKHGKKGAYGRQILYRTLAQAVISPSVGALMDYISAKEGSPDYLAPFIIHNILLAFSVISIYKTTMDLELSTDEDSMIGIRFIFTNPEILLFLVMMFVCGVMYGFVETFLFVFLKEDLHAPIFLLGLTITTGAVVSIPFLYYSDNIVKKAGCDRVIVFALLMYAVRYVGYSFVRCAWYAFPFEALEVFTFFFLQVGAAEFIRTRAPEGLLGTLSGLKGGCHDGFGRGFGGLVGGVLIESTKSTHKAFWYFGVSAFVCSILFASFVSLFMVKKNIVKRNKSRNSSKEEKDKVGEKDDEIKSFLGNEGDVELKNMRDPEKISRSEDDKAINGKAEDENEERVAAISLVGNQSKTVETSEGKENSGNPPHIEPIIQSN
ncbi:uncharacterized protein LOC111710915 isoform X2 [Eurytemora carolleeae]|nr:uncharacterized protein LOC111710915 isoform X2 [Eurytemora carolleeae]|eukprot:XP_023340878.1 uncharacterized protein LOC111710915 isoform X2 [Eurytemora affinis]